MIMKLGIVISTNDPETAWNAYRLANFAATEGDDVKVFLLGKGVESEIEHSEYNVKEQISKFTKSGHIYACGTCLKSRQMEGSDTCPVSSMENLYQIIKECDKVVNFG